MRDAFAYESNVGVNRLSAVSRARRKPLWGLRSVWLSRAPYFNCDLTRFFSELSFDLIGEWKNIAMAMYIDSDGVLFEETGDEKKEIMGNIAK